MYYFAGSIVFQSVHNNVYKKIFSQRTSTESAIFVSILNNKCEQKLFATKLLANMVYLLDMQKLLFAKNLQYMVWNRK